LHITPAHVKFSAFETKEEVPIIRAEIPGSPNNQAKKEKRRKRRRLEFKPAKMSLRVRQMSRRCNE